MHHKALKLASGGGIEISRSEVPEPSEGEILVPSSPVYSVGVPVLMLKTQVKNVCVGLVSGPSLLGWAF